MLYYEYGNGAIEGAFHMYTVILERGDLEPLVFTDFTKRRAMQRASCLSWLHGEAEVSWEDDRRATVHASGYYAD